MSLKKNPRFDLKLQYQRVFEIGIIISLLLISLAFKFFPTIEKQKVMIEQVQPLVNVLDVEITRQKNRPPVPPKPPIPIEAPSNDIMPDIEIRTTEINANDKIPPPAPPKVETKILLPEPDIFRVVEEMPEPLGGIQAIQNKIIYPEIAKRAGVEGRVYINAFIDEKGNVFKTEIIKGIGAGCDEAAEEAVRAAKFKPGKQRGKPVKVQVTVPIFFKLQ